MKTESKTTFANMLNTTRAKGKESNPDNWIGRGPNDLSIPFLTGK